MILKKLLPVLVNIKNFVKQFPFIRPMGIVYSAKEWISQNNQKLDWFNKKNSDWYLVKQQESVVCYSQPNSIYKDLTIYFKDNLVKKNLEANIYFFKGAYVFSNYGTVISRKSEVFAEFCHYFNTKKINKGEVFRPFAALKLNIKKIPENTAILAAPESENYYHWMMDSLPRFCLLEEFIAAIDYFIIPAHIHDFHIDSLKYWGISKNKLIKIDSTDKLYFENLFVPSLPGSEGNSPKWAIDYLRQKFLIPEQNPQKETLVFFARKNVTQRRIVNEIEVIQNLKARGFLIYEMSSYSFDEQILISRKAKVIVSCHGAALTNLLFTDDCKVLEIFSPDYIRPDCYFTLANQLDLEYWYLLGRNFYQDKKLLWGDIYIDINELNITLDRMLNVE